jgi:hypothetical protein
MAQPPRRRTVALAVGGLVGATIAPVMAVMAFLAVDRTPSYGWDLGAVFLLVPIVGVSVIVGGVAGALGAARLATGDWSGVGMILWAALIVTATPIAILVGIYVVVPLIPGRTAPASGAERDEWIARIRTPDLAAGLQLAYAVRSCVHTRGLQLGAVGLAFADCGSLTQSRGDVADRTRYLSGDHGWRWKIVPEPPETRVVIYPDELLKVETPVFEVWESGVLVKRERPGAPAFVVRSDLPAVQQYRACLLAAASAARGAGTWNGDWVSLIDAIGRNLTCTNLTARADEANATGMQNVRLFLESPAHESAYLSYRPVRSTDDGFDLLVHGSEHRYLLDRHGQWHVTLRMQFASESDPPPLPCEMDLKVPCDGPVLGR